MKITYWSDFPCPFCYIGSARMKRAIRELYKENEIELEMKSFRLAPKDTKEPPKEDIVTMIVQAKGMSFLQAKRLVDEISSMGRTAALDLNYATVHITDATDAHRLAKYTADQGGSVLADQVIDALYKAYFSDNLELADRKVLLSAATSSGMVVEDVEKMLDSNQYLDEILLDEREAGRYGVQGVPFFVVGQYGISGAQSVEVMKNAILRACDDEKHGGTNDMGGATCGPNGCGF